MRSPPSSRAGASIRPWQSIPYKAVDIFCARLDRLRYFGKPSAFTRGALDFWQVVSTSPANTVTCFEKSGLIAGHEPPLLWAIIIWVIMIRWRSRRSHVQFARVERQDRSTLTRNSAKRSVIVQATTPLGWMNGSSTSGGLKENQCRSDHECKGYFHREILSYTFCDPSRIT